MYRTPARESKVSEEVGEVGEATQVSEKLAKAPYWNTDSLEKVQRELPEGVKLTRGVYKKAVSPLVSHQLNKQAVVQNLPPTENRFAAFTVEFTPGVVPTEVNSSKATNQNISSSLKESTSVNAQKNLDKTFEKITEDHNKGEQPDKYIKPSGHSSQGNLVVTDCNLEIKNQIKQSDFISPC